MYYVIYVYKIYYMYYMVYIYKGYIYVYILLDCIILYWLISLFLSVCGLSGVWCVLCMNFCGVSGF